MVATAPSARPTENSRESEGPVDQLLRLTGTAGLLRSTALADCDANHRDATMDGNDVEDSPRETAQSDRWSESPQRFTAELRQLAPQLAMHGLYMHSTRGSCGQRPVRLARP